MLLGEALEEVSSLSKRFDSLRERARGNARFQEGEDPAEDSDQLTTAASLVLVKLETLTRQIQHTNSVTMLRNNFSLADALISRAILAKHQSLYSTVADAASPDSRFGLLRTSRSELKMISNVDISAYRGRAEELAAMLRKLNTEIQQANWSTDLQE